MDQEFISTKIIRYDYSVDIIETLENMRHLTI